MGELSNYYFNQYVGGNRDVIAPLRSEEPNLLHARSLARQHGWWDRVISAMQGLLSLYDHTGRRAEWKRLVEEIVPDFVGADDLPLSGREEQWSLVTQYRMQLAMEKRNLAEAERFQRLQVDEQRRHATSLLARPAESLSTREKNTIRSLAASLNQLADIQAQVNSPECVKSNEEAFTIANRIGDNAVAAICGLNLGHAYKDLPALRNLDEAERWYRRSLELRAEGDTVGQAKSKIQFGIVAYERFRDAKKEGEVEEELLKHLNAAVNYYQQALALLPPDAVNDLAVTHNQLGIIYKNAGDLERALNHYNNAAKFFEAAGNLHHAGGTQFNLAIMLSQNGRHSDALLYARAALRNYESYGGRAKDQEDKTKGLIAEIEGLMKG